jgi:hypothetical protein
MTTWHSGANAEYLYFESGNLKKKKYSKAIDIERNQRLYYQLFKS